LIAVVADPADPEAAGLVERWGHAGAIMVTPDDLSRAGWVVGFPDAGPHFVAGGEIRRTAELSGVVVRLPAVLPGHLPHLRDEDRDYASAEMTAFLSYWLGALRCPVINRPSPSFLLGPAWTNAQWLGAAAALALRVRTARVTNGVIPAPGDLNWVTVVGDESLGDVDWQGTAAVALARASGVALLGVGFEGGGTTAAVAAVSIRPPITHAVADALLAEFAAAET
jgi:hypothetical protein